MPLQVVKHGGDLRKFEEIRISMEFIANGTTPCSSEKTFVIPSKAGIQRPR
jgi:hypothetical protein